METQVTKTGITKFVALNKPAQPKKGKPLYSVALVLKGKDAVEVASKIEEFLDYQVDNAASAFMNLKKSGTKPYKNLGEEGVVFYFNSPNQPTVCQKAFGELEDVDLQNTHIWSGGDVRVAYIITAFKAKDGRIAASLLLQGVEIISTRTDRGVTAFNKNVFLK